jgi:cell division transport system permease protein
MKKSDIPFNSDDAHAFLPWVIGIMVSMATLLLCLQLTVGSWIIDRSDSYANSFTVNVPATEDADNKTDKIRAALEKLPGVVSVTQVSDASLREMLGPWLGNGDSVAQLPLPAVLDVTLKKNAHIDFTDVESKLGDIVAGTEIDAHERWIAAFANFSATVQWLITSLALLIIGGLALMIASTSRAALKLHARTVQLLHSIGAEDGYITRQFQREAFLMTLRGTVPGCILAGAAYWAVGRYSASLETSMLPSLGMSWSHLLLLLTMPLACGIVAWVAARISVLKQLQRVL